MGAQFFPAYLQEILGIAFASEVVAFGQDDNFVAWDVVFADRLAEDFF
jgi:hypothetical protein